MQKNPNEFFQKRLVYRTEPTPKPSEIQGQPEMETESPQPRPGKITSVVNWLRNKVSGFLETPELPSPASRQKEQKLLPDPFEAYKEGRASGTIPKPEKRQPKKAITNTGGLPQPHGKGQREWNVTGVSKVQNPNSPFSGTVTMKAEPTWLTEKPASQKSQNGTAHSSARPERTDGPKKLWETVGEAGRGAITMKGHVPHGPKEFNKRERWEDTVGTTGTEDSSAWPEQTDGGKRTWVETGRSKYGAITMEATEKRGPRTPYIDPVEEGIARLRAEKSAKESATSEDIVVLDHNHPLYTQVRLEESIRELERTEREMEKRRVERAEKAKFKKNLPHSVDVEPIPPVNMPPIPPPLPRQRSYPPRTSTQASPSSSQRLPSQE